MRRHLRTREQLESVDENGSTLAQRLEDARLILKVVGYLRDSESDRIKRHLSDDWETR